MDPKLLTLTLRASVADSGPFLEALIREGIADGSIAVAQPKEFSEAFMILMNLWVGVFSSTREDFMSKMHFLKDLTDHMGLPVLDDHLLSVCQVYYERILALSSQPPPPEVGMPSASGSALPAQGGAHRPGP